MASFKVFSALLGTLAPMVKGLAVFIKYTLYLYNPKSKTFARKLAFMYGEIQRCWRSVTVGDAERLVYIITAF